MCFSEREDILEGRIWVLESECSLYHCWFYGCDLTPDPVREEGESRMTHNSCCTASRYGNEAHSFTLTPQICGTCSCRRDGKLGQDERERIFQDLMGEKNPFWQPL